MFSSNEIAKCYLYRLRLFENAGISNKLHKIDMKSLSLVVQW
jgi:hypothetical protein